jgi:hypothetical protein
MRLFNAVFLLVTTLATLCWSADQDVLTILKQQSDIGLFTTYLELFPDIIDLLNQGIFTGVYKNNVFHVADSII